MLLVMVMMIKEKNCYGGGKERKVHTDADLLRQSVHDLSLGVEDVRRASGKGGLHLDHFVHVCSSQFKKQIVFNHIR